jgi:hypothetical protein
MDPRQFSTIERVFLTLVTLDKAFLLTLECLLVYGTWGLNSSSALSIALVLIPRELFALYLAWNSVLDENKYGILAFFFVQSELLANSVSTLILETFHPSSEKTASIAIACIILVWLSVEFVLGLKCIDGFGWKFFTIIGADLKLMSMFQVYQKIQALIRLDRQVTLRLVVLSFVAVVEQRQFTFKLILGLVFVIEELLWNLSIRIAVREEMDVLMKFGISVLVLGFPFVVVLFYVLRLANRPTLFVVLPPLFAYVITRILVTFYCFKALNNFHQGLKENVLTKIHQKPFLLPFRISASYNEPLVPESTEGSLNGSELDSDGQSPKSIN